MDVCTITRCTIRSISGLGLNSYPALSPFPNLEMQHDRKECWNLKSGWKKFTTFASLWEGKRDLLESTKMDFMRLRNESTLWWSRWRFPQRLSIDPNGSWCVCLSDTKHVRRNVQSCIRTCSPVIWQWCGDSPHQDLPRSDSVVWPLIHV